MRFYLQVSSLLQSPAGGAGSAVAARERSRDALRPPHAKRSHEKLSSGARLVPLGPAPPSLRLCPALPTPTQVAAPQGRPGGVCAAPPSRSSSAPREVVGEREPEPGAPVLPNQLGPLGRFQSREEQPACLGSPRLAERRDVKSGRRQMTSLNGAVT